MEKLKAKLKKQGGFTLIEMLIVVAIIAILIAVSIPMVSNALERSRNAVDQANFRSAAALGSIEYLSEGITAEITRYYKVDDSSAQGTLVADKADATAGLCTGSITGTCDADGHTNKVIQVVISPDSTVAVSWVAK